MKKRLDFCPQCDKDTTHREKKVSFRRSKKEGYGTRVLSLKCMTCGYLHGGVKTITSKKKKHISMGS